MLTPCMPNLKRTQLEPKADVTFLEEMTSIINIPSDTKGIKI
jgi:hypothetical protein